MNRVKPLRITKEIVSLLLIFTVMVGLFVPFDIVSVFAAEDHRNFDGYRLYTLVITYETAESASKKGESLDARAYIRYYDANGKLRVFYNNYNNTQYYGGCMCSFNQVAEMAIAQAEEESETTG